MKYYKKFCTATSNRKNPGQPKEKIVKFWSTSYKVRVHHFVVFASELEFVVFQELCVILEIAATEGAEQSHDSSTVVLQSCRYPGLPARFASRMFARCFQHVACTHHTQVAKLVFLWHRHVHDLWLFRRRLTATWKKIERRAAFAWVVWFVGRRESREFWAFSKVGRDLLALLVWISITFNFLAAGCDLLGFGSFLWEILVL